MPRRLVQRLHRDQSGAVAIMGAVGGLLACVATAAVIEAASVGLKGREIQAAADLAAMAAARSLSRAEAAANATVSANLALPATVRTRVGVYTADVALERGARFQTAAFGPASNAAEVKVTAAAPLMIGRVLLGRESVSVTRTGLAAIRSPQPHATFSIGSRLASLDGGIANEVLSALTGSRVSLTVMDYRGLAEADVELLAFTDALATRLHVKAGDYDSLLDQSINAGEALRVLSTVSDGGTAALEALGHAARGRTVRIRDLIGLETASPQAARDGLEVRLSSLDVASALIQVASGERQAALNLGVRAGVAETKVFLGIGERPNQAPWLTVTDKGEPVIRTAQTRLYIELKSADVIAGIGQIRLPVLVEIAAAEAKLARIDCGENRAVSIDARPGVARIRIATVEDAAALANFKAAVPTTEAALVKLPLIKVIAGADVRIDQTSFVRLRFTEAEIRNQATKSASTTTAGSSLTSSLLQNMTLKLEVIGLGLGLDGLLRSVGLVVSSLGPALDSVLTGVLTTLGVRVGEVDVSVQGMRCGEANARPVLVG